MKGIIAAAALGAAAFAASPAQAAVVPTGSWGGGKTIEPYYFSPTMTIAKSGKRYIGTATTAVSWTAPPTNLPFNGGGIFNSCNIPSGTQVLKIRKQRRPKNTYTGSIILIYNLMTTGPGQPTPVPFACDVHIFGAIVGLAKNGESFRLKSIDGPDTFPSVTYRKLLL